MLSGVTGLVSQKVTPPEENYQNGQVFFDSPKKVQNISIFKKNFPTFVVKRFFLPKNSFIPKKTTKNSFQTQHLPKLAKIAGLPVAGGGAGMGLGAGKKWVREGKCQADSKKQVNCNYLLKKPTPLFRGGLPGTNPVSHSEGETPVSLPPPWQMGTL